MTLCCSVIGAGIVVGSVAAARAGAAGLAGGIAILQDSKHHVLPQQKVAIFAAVRLTAGKTKLRKGYCIP